MVNQRVSYEGLITTGQAAAAFEPPCSTENIRRLVRVGQLPVAVIVGRGQMLFERSAVQRIIDQRRARSGVTGSVSLCGTTE